MAYSLWGDRDLIAEFASETDALAMARELLEDGFPLDELWLDSGDGAPLVQREALVEQIRTLYPSVRLSA
jgi:hypothetical protein